MPVESLILRRCYPVPVTLSDLCDAYDALQLAGIWSRHKHDKCNADWGGGPCEIKSGTMRRWHAAIKESTGAIDEVYAVIDGREVRVAIVDQHSIDIVGGPRHIAKDIADLLIKADEAGYWERPHEVVHVLEERAISRRTVNLACGVSPDKAGA